MTFEEIQRTMEFLVQHGAQLDARVESLVGHGARVDARFEKLASEIHELRESDARLRDSQVTLTASVVRIAELFEESIKSGDKRFEGLEKNLLRTDERLNVLVSVVEKHITGHNHGRKTRRK